MKIALCLHGLVGTDDKYGKGDKAINYKIGQKHFQRHVIGPNDEVDVFYHTWSTEYEKELEEEYKPVSSSVEEQPHFSDDPRRQAIYCRWLSTKKVLELVNKSDKEYDFVLLTRFDIAFLVDFKFNNFDNTKFYAQGPPGPKTHNFQLVNDLCFFASQENMSKFSNLWDNLDHPEYQKCITGGGNHELARKHLLETGLDSDIEYYLKREWTGAPGKLSTETPLVRWHYFKKV